MLTPQSISRDIIKKSACACIERILFYTLSVKIWKINQIIPLSPKYLIDNNQYTAIILTVNLSRTEKTVRSL